MAINEKESKAEDGTGELERLKALSRQGGGPERIEAQHKRGKLTARERVEILLDEGSFEEMDALATHRSTEFGLDKQKYYGDAVVIGFGKIDGRLVYVFSQDFTVFGGSLSEVAGEKICKVMDLAMKNGAPLIGINDGGGARIQEGVVSLKGYGEIFTRNVLASGVVPQISVVMGPSAGGAVYSPAITDFIFMKHGSGQMYITGPDVVRAVTHEDVTHEDLGGASVHSSKTGVAHFALEGEEDCLNEVRRLVSFIPSNNVEDPPYLEPGDLPDRLCDELVTVVPPDPSKPYDVHLVIESILDDGDFMEVHSGWARNITVGFGRMNGRVVGVVANNPTACAIAEAVRTGRRNGDEEGNGRCLKNLIVASFGTGDVLRRISGREAARWGAVRWAVPIIDVLFGGSTDAVDYIAGQLIEQENFFRFQLPLDQKYERMDNASPENIDVLTHLATHYIDSGPGRRKLEALVQRLAAG